MIIVFDLDGTLVFDGMTIAPRITKELLRLNKQSRIIFASARPIRDMEPVLTAFPNNDLIGGNGSIVRHNGEISSIASLNPGVVQKVVEVIRSNNLDYVIDYDWDYSARISKNNLILNKLDIERKATNIPIQFNHVLKIILFGVTKGIYQSLDLEDEAVALYHEDAQELVITAKHIDKYQTLTKLIGNQSYLAFGNDKNDLELLKHAELSVVIGDNADVVSVSQRQLPADNGIIADYLSDLLRDISEIGV
jgi:HAD superfamily hydrolase (TIGR01484 family)